MKKVKKLITSLLVASIMMPTMIASATTSMSAPQLGQWIVSGGQQGSYETPLYGQYNPYTYPASQQAQNATWGQIRDGIITNFASQVISGILNGGNASTSQGTGTYITDGEGRQVPITRQNGAMQTPGNDTSYVWWTVKPENNKTRGVFQASIVADPPHPLDGRPIRGKLRIATVSNINMLRGFFDDKEVQLHQVRQGLWESGWFEMEKEAAFGTYDPRHAFSVIGQSGSTVGTMAGTISYTVDKFAAMGTNGTGSATYGSIDAIQSNYKALQDNKNSSIGGEADVTGTITGMESKDGKTVMTITEDSGKSIQVIAADSNRLPTGLKTGDKIRAVGSPTKNVDGSISLNATALTAPGVKSEKKQMQINNGKPTEKTDVGANSLADIMKLAQEEEAKIKGQQGAVAPTPSGGGNNTPHPGSGGPIPQSKEEFVENAAKNQVGFLKSILNHLLGNGDKPNTIAEMSDQAPGMISARSTLGVIASVVGIAVGGFLIFGIGALSAPVLIGAAVIGLGICAVTGGFSDIGDFLNNSGYLSYLIKEHPGSVAADVALGAVTSMLPGIGSVAGRLLSGSKTAALATAGQWLTAKMPATAGPIGDIFQSWKAESQVAKSISEKIAFTGRNNEGLRDSLKKTAENMRNGEQLSAKLSTANPKLSPQEIGQIKKYSDRILKSDGEIIHEVETELKVISNLSQTKNTQGFYEVNKVKINENFESTERFSGNVQQIKNHVEEVNENIAIRNTNNALKDVKIDQSRISKLFTGINTQGAEVIDQKIK